MKKINKIIFKQQKKYAQINYPKFTPIIGTIDSAILNALFSMLYANLVGIVFVYWFEVFTTKSTAAMVMSRRSFH